ncbi:hypothetical protein O181_022013 [Austropuccinia psidii MF-1]|uniref:Anaphase-promoting complex subunit 4 WD40 domain-containing protein n=1 Tax=Austropuccinia psidii MF-1 TaxID=1389203 RepID=A0A9Q3CEE5_9BASI|nr:hypothetical protein [Austropuccinia psidii MF-1]
MLPEVLDYDSPCSTFALAFSPLGSSSGLKSHSLLPDLKLAIGSAMESFSNNHLTIIGLNSSLNFSSSHSSGYDPYEDSVPFPPSSSHFQPLATAPHPYPPTAIAFSPTRLSKSLQASSGNNQMVRTREMLATSSECIRLWDFAQSLSDEDGSSGFVGGDHRRPIGIGVQKSAGYQLVLRSQMANSKAEYSAPLTSFSWSQLDPSLIVTSSIDTTCTVWDISSSSAITQLIAHDREVYDVCWSSASREIFASVGADGSVRLFDLRSLDHSTILYEAQAGPLQAGRNGISSSSISPAVPNPTAPLLRLKFNPIDPNYIAVSSALGTEVQVLDVRAPGVPVVELRAHQAPVNGLSWSGDGNIIGTCGDDCQVLVWDLSGVSNSSGNTSNNLGTNSRSTNLSTKKIREPILAYTAPQEVNAISWCEAYRDWIAIGLGKKIRCLRV